MQFQNEVKLISVLLLGAGENAYSLTGWQVTGACLLLLLGETGRKENASTTNNKKNLLVIALVLTRIITSGICLEDTLV